MGAQRRSVTSVSIVGWQFTDGRLSSERPSSSRPGGPRRTRTSNRRVCGVFATGVGFLWTIESLRENPGTNAAPVPAIPHRRTRAQRNATRRPGPATRPPPHGTRPRPRPVTRPRRREIAPSRPRIAPPPPATVSTRRGSAERLPPGSRTPTGTMSPECCHAAPAATSSGRRSLGPTDPGNRWSSPSSTSTI